MLSVGGDKGHNTEVEHAVYGMCSSAGFGAIVL